MSKAHADEKKPKTMNYKTVKYSVFTEAMTKLSITTPGDLSEHLGYSRSAHNIWRKSGRLPKTAGLACECLLRRQGKQDGLPAPRDVFVMLVPEDNAKMLLALCDTMGAKLITRLPVS